MIHYSQAEMLSKGFEFNGNESIDIENYEYYTFEKVRDAQFGKSMSIPSMFILYELEIPNKLDIESSIRYYYDLLSPLELGDEVFEGDASDFELNKFKDNQLKGMVKYGFLDVIEGRYFKSKKNLEESLEFYFESIIFGQPNLLRIPCT